MRYGAVSRIRVGSWSSSCNCVLDSYLCVLSTGSDRSTIRRQRHHEFAPAKSVDDPLATYTLWLAIFTGCLVAVSGVQGWFLYRADKTTRMAANAAAASADALKDSADAADATERARLYVIVQGNFEWLIEYAKQQQQVWQPTQILTNSFEIKYLFRNYGKTPAIIKEFSIGTQISPHPFDPVYTMMLEAFSENMIAAGDTTETKSFTVRPPITVGEGSALVNNNAAMWVYGYVEYEDVFGSAHTHRFFLRTVTVGNNCLLQSYDYKHYNRST
jgi:cbb3-type cytochrome oxidase subunit 3